jgi:autotransporter passenger strand-loop-strand repeat protein
VPPDRTISFPPLVRVVPLAVPPLSTDLRTREDGHAAGGIEEIGFGYTLSGFIVSSGVILEVAYGGTVSNTTVLSGGSLVVSSGGLADPTTVYTGGSETISSGGTDLGALISGGTQFDYGLASADRDAARNRTAQKL